MGKIGTMPEPEVTTVMHRTLGAMTRMAITPELTFDLTHQEAWTLARAFQSTNNNHQIVDMIYLSPCTSDRDFSARVTPAGLEAATVDGGSYLIPWDDVATLAERLFVLG